MSRDVRVRVGLTVERPGGGFSLLVHIDPEHAADLTRDGLPGTATLNLPEGPR